MPQPSLTDDEFQRLLATDVNRAWRAFVDAYTPMLVALIERGGVRDRDETMEVYTLVCERLTADSCLRLRRRDPAKGGLGGWLAVVVRHALVDWVRQRAGRRRLFGAVRRLDELHQRVFELYFWEERPASEIAEVLSVTMSRRISLVDVLAALDTIHASLSDRHRSELLSASMRARPPISLEMESDEQLELIDERGDPHEALLAGESAAAFDAALAQLPAEDAAIVRLHYVNALSLAEVQRALHLPELTERRVRGIVDRLRTHMTSAAGRPALATPHEGRPVRRSLGEGG